MTVDVQLLKRWKMRFKDAESGNLSSTNVNHNGSGTRNPAIQQRKSQHVIAGYISNIDKSQLAGYCENLMVGPLVALLSTWMMTEFCVRKLERKKQTVAVQSSDFSFNTKYLCLNFHCLVLDVIFHTIHMFVASNHVCVAKIECSLVSTHTLSWFQPPKKDQFCFLEVGTVWVKIGTPRIR